MQKTMLHPKQVLIGQYRLRYSYSLFPSLRNRGRMEPYGGIMFFKLKSPLKIAPDIGQSYAVKENGEPEIVFYRPESNVFVNRKLDTDTRGYFVRIMRPVILDVDNVQSFELPDLPKESDGFILINFGIHKSRAYALRNPNSRRCQHSKEMISRAIPIDLENVFSMASDRLLITPYV